MTFIQKLTYLIKKKISFPSLLEARIFRIKRFNPFFLISFLVIFSIIFFITSNLINKKNKEKENNFREITRTNDFLNLTSFLISKINSPYKEVDYIIKNNDTVEKILKQFKIKNEDIRNISIKLKARKLTNIYSGRKLSLITK